MSKQLVLLEINEVNFKFIERYVAERQLNNFGELIARHGYCETVSEQSYEELEPWIQWVTAHSGKTLAEHGVFRLGDITRIQLLQVWEDLEAKGYKVGAVSPMNAANRLRNPAFFIPDPWTNTPPAGSSLLRAFAQAVTQAVNDNANGRLTPRTASALLAALLLYVPRSHWLQYIRWVLESRRAPWRRALFLDRLLSDVFFMQWRKHRPGFATLFLNGGAHIQHHYLYSSSAYKGNLRNPTWYVSHDYDPVLEAYELYDAILGEALALGCRVMVATGLHQDPYGKIVYYWRLRDHRAFLDKARIPYTTVRPRMSRDFLVECGDEDQARKAEKALAGAASKDGELIFSVDNRGRDLFVTLEYPHDIGEGFAIHINGREITNFRRHVVFVAIKNGHHCGIGYFSDSGIRPEDLPKQFPLKEIPARIREALGVARTAELSNPDAKESRSLEKSTCSGAVS